MTTPPENSFELHLPAGTAALYEQRITAIPEGRRSAWRYHRVSPDDSLASVAHTYHVTVPELAAANQLHTDQSVAGIEALVVPVAPVAAPSLHTLLYTTRRGDTLVSIADRFGVSLDQLRRWNKIPGGIKVEPGRRLHVAEPAALQRTSANHRGGSTSSHGAKHGSANSPSARGGDPPSQKESPHKSQATPAKSYAKKQK
jgi:membrane-bound lytic murein transglycosylase D